MRFALLLTLSLAAAGLVRAESAVVTLKSGGRLEGTIVRESEVELVLGIQGGSIRVAKKDVANVERKADAPRPAAPAAERLPGWSRVLEVIVGQEHGRELRQVPATVIDEGVLANVPYVSHRFGDLELNVYGDPDHPVGYEVGVLRGGQATPARKQAVVKVVQELLSNADDRRTLVGLKLEKDRQSRNGLTFEVTPADAPDSYGGWWVSVYDEAGLAKARASAAELEEITDSDAAGEGDDPLGWQAEDYKEARPRRAPTQPIGTAAPAPPTPSTTTPPPNQYPRRVYRRGFVRQDGTYVRRRVIRR
jgi:hypothetical protein